MSYIHNARVFFRHTQKVAIVQSYELENGKTLH